MVVVMVDSGVGEKPYKGTEKVKITLKLIGNYCNVENDGRQTTEKVENMRLMELNVREHKIVEDQDEQSQ